MITRTIKIEVEVDITYPYRNTHRIRITHPEMTGALIKDVEDDGELDIDDVVEEVIQSLEVAEPEPAPIPEPTPEPKVEKKETPMALSITPPGGPETVINSALTIIDRVSRIRNMLKK